MEPDREWLELLEAYAFHSIHAQHRRPAQPNDPGGDQGYQIRFVPAGPQNASFQVGNVSLDRPADLVCDRAGNLYVLDAGNRRVLMITAPTSGYLGNTSLWTNPTSQVVLDSTSHLFSNGVDTGATPGILCGLAVTPDFNV